MLIIIVNILILTCNFQLKTEVSGSPVSGCPPLIENRARIPGAYVSN